MNKLSELLKIQTFLEDLRVDTDKYVVEADENSDGSFLVLEAYKVCELIIKVILESKGCQFDENGLVVVGYNGERLKRPTFHMQYVRQSEEEVLPRECIDLINTMRIYRNNAAHPVALLKPEVQLFSNAFDSFVAWLLLEYPAAIFEGIDEASSLKLMDRFFSLGKALSQNKTNQIYVAMSEDTKETEQKELLILLKKNLNEMQAVRAVQEDVKQELRQVKDAIDDIKNMISILTEQIEGYQSLVARQMEMAVTEEEVERIMQAYSDVCTEKIIKGINRKITTEEFETEEKLLQLSFGNDTWNKLDESSKTFLISSKVIFKNMLGLENAIDYSGVCLLVTKAIEVELNNRFYKQFIAYLKLHYPGKLNYNKYPTALINPKGFPIESKNFTLGSVAYILCYRTVRGETTDVSEKNKSILLEYCRSELFKGKIDNEIFDMLQQYADCVEEIRNDYRNPSAHTNTLQKIEAEQCFDLIIDVEKFLKKMLDSFDK